MQGALGALTAMLADVSDALHLEVMQTIRALLSNNLRNQVRARVCVCVCVCVPPISPTHYSLYPVPTTALSSAPC